MVTEYVWPDCDRCGHPWGCHQHYRVSMVDDCSMLGCWCHSYRHPPGRIVAWCRRWLW